MPTQTVRPPRPRVPLWVVLLVLAAAAAWNYARSSRTGDAPAPAPSHVDAPMPPTRESPSRPSSPTDSRDTTTAHTPGDATSDANASTRHDLSIDERRGGHTLARHVGRTDAELADRLDRERDISAASTYTDRPSAEATVAGALSHNDARIRAWLRRTGGHPNLALDYHGSRVIGRTLARGRTEAAPSVDALVVLKWAGPDDYYVLTSYPEARR